MNEKTKELVAIGASVGAHCQPCLTYHVTKAKEVGLTEDEIREAIAIGHMVEKGAMSAMRQFSAGIFEQAPEEGGCCGPASPQGRKCCG